MWDMLVEAVGPRLVTRTTEARISTSSQIKRWAAVEAERAFAAYGLPTRPMPPRYLLRPERPVVPEPEAAVIVRRPAAKSVSKRKRTVGAAVRDTPVLSGGCACSSGN